MGYLVHREKPCHPSSLYLHLAITQMHKCMIFRGPDIAYGGTYHFSTVHRKMIYKPSQQYLTLEFANLKPQLTINKREDPSVVC